MRLTLFWALMCILVLSDAQAHTQRETTGQIDPVSEWIRAEWDRAKSPVLDGYIVKVRFEHWYFPADTELERLAHQVAGKPEHPDRQTLSVYLQRKRGVPTAYNQTIWFKSPDSWRLSEDFDSPEFPAGAFMDCVSTPEHAFWLGRTTLSVMDPRKGIPAHKDVRSKSSLLRQSLSAVLHGGLYFAARGGSEIESITLNGNTWTVRASGIRRLPEPRPIEVRGRWSPEDGRGFVEEIRELVPPASMPSVWRASDWRKDPVLGLWMCGKVEEHQRDQLTYRFALAGFEHCTPDRTDAVLALPSNGADGFRGEIKPTIVHDYVNGQAALSISEGQTEIVPISAKPEVQAATHALPRLFLWTGAVCVVVSVGMIGWRNAKRAREKEQSLS
ncbi:MAG: hypothetical protein ACK4WH_02890 [Phycisphaerales bacterium]